MKIVIALFNLLFVGYVNGCLTHEDIFHTKKDRKNFSKMVRQILEKGKTADHHVNQARKKVKIDDMYFAWSQDPMTKKLSVNVWLAYDLINRETNEKEVVEDCLQDISFSKKELKHMRLNTFCKKVSKSLQ